MFTRSSDCLAALLPFVFVSLAGVVGITSDVDLFSRLDNSSSSPTSIDTVRHAAVCTTNWYCSNNEP